MHEYVRVKESFVYADTELFNRPIILLLSIVKNIQLVRRTQTTLKRKFTRSKTITKICSSQDLRK